jgi:sulfate permease, SulP family
VATLEALGTARWSASAQRLLRDLVAGIVCGFLAVILTVSFGSLLFTGALRTYVEVAVGMALFSTVVVAMVAALTSPIRGAVSVVQEIPVVAIVGPAATIAAAMEGASLRDTMVTVVVAVGLATLATGAVLIALGAFRLGNLIRYVPFPVIGGFLAGTGWLILRGGVDVIAGVPVGLLSIVTILAEPSVQFKTAASLALVTALAALDRRTAGRLATPLLILGSVVAFNLVRIVAGIPLAEIQATGWVVPLRAGTALWPPIGLADLAVVDWSAMASGAVMLPAIILITVMALLMNATGIEMDTRRDVDLDKELRSVGLQCLASGAGGGMPGFPAVSLSLLATRLGAPTRTVGLIVAVIVLGVLAFGEEVLNLMPTPVLGGLLVWIGGTLMAEWLFRAARRLRLGEYLVILLIFAVIVGAGFPDGILAGLVAAVILFVVEYGRIDSIRHVFSGRDYHATPDMTEERRNALSSAGDAILIVRLQGFLFFGSADRLRKAIEDRIAGPTPVRFLIVDFARVTGLDSSAAMNFVRLAQIAARHKVALVISGAGDAVRRALFRSGLEEAAPGTATVEIDLHHALARCEAALLAVVAPGLDGENKRDAADIAADILGEPEAAADLARYFTALSLEAGDRLIEEGTPSHEMYFVGSGRAAVTIRAQDGAAMTVATVGPGAILGELAFYLDQPRTATVTAETPMQVWRFAGDDLARLRRDAPELALRFHQGIAAMLARRLTSTDRLVRLLAD